ncbi:F-box only protein 8-like [Rutidosis leptorrhynchoides]|uniref:F-box only protein 8-like n=1 Tax=Rutidosis leptorrhynchoides TaxID=125765 RepID=UPI003A99E960
MTTTTSEIPIEVLFSEILSRLPVKSVLRFRCVSKQWYSLLSSQSFKNKHLDRITVDVQQNPNMFLQISGRDCQVHEDDASGLITHTRPLPFISKYDKSVVILASFHGLVCAGVLLDPRHYLYSDLYLWNPLTDEFKRLPKTHYHSYTDLNPRCGLYYSSSDNDYKLLCVNPIDDRVYSYSLKNDSWRNMADATNSLKKTLSRLDSWSQLHWLNDNNLFFLKKGYPKETGCTMNGPSYSMGYSIIKFDTKTEKFTEISIPSCYKKSPLIRASCLLTVRRNKLHLTVKSDKYEYNIGWIPCIKVWSLNEERWTTVETYRPMMSCLFSNLKPVHLMRNKNWLMMGYNYNNYGGYSRDYYLHVLKFDDEKTNNRSRCSYRLVNTGVKSEIAAVRYIETLVSPNQYMNQPKFRYKLAKKKSIYQRLLDAFSCLQTFIK